MRGRINKEKRGEGKTGEENGNKKGTGWRKGNKKKEGGREREGGGGSRKIRGINRENEDGWIRDEMERGWGRI